MADSANRSSDDGAAPAAGIGAPLAAHAAARPQAIALAIDGETLTWAALHRAVEARAAEIAALPPGGVALRLSNSVAFVVLFLAAARAGREAQVLDPAWPDETVAHVRAALAPALSVTECPGDAAGAGERDAACLVVAPRLRLSDLPPLAAARAEPLPAPDPSSAFYVGFTSGSTGIPKGCRRSHRSWCASFAVEKDEFAIGPGDVVAAPAAFTHSLFLYAVIGGLHAGATVISLRRFRPEAVARLLFDEPVTVLWGVPTHLGLVLDRLASLGRSADRLRLVLSGGAKWSAVRGAELRAWMPNALFAEFYGASELSFVALARSDEDVPEGSVGRPFAGVRITVRDRRGRRLPPGRRGLVHVESELVFIDYALGGDGDPCLRHGREVSVGDAGRLDARGFLHLGGRWKRMIVTAGRNVFPEEIERRVEAMPDIAAAAVVGRPDARRGERLVGAFAARGPAPTPAAIVARLREMLPFGMVPTVWVELADWPLTASGKTDFTRVAARLATATRGEGA